MLDFIVKYWLEVVFGLISAGLAYSYKKLTKLYKDEKERQKQQEKSALITEVKDMMLSCKVDLLETIQPHEDELKKEDEKINNEIRHINDTMDVLKGGMLSLQGRDFKEECRRLIEDVDKITTAEYEQLIEDHMVYNSLGGNHTGDSLFAAAKQKYENQLSK